MAAKKLTYILGSLLRPELSVNVLGGILKQYFDETGQHATKVISTPKIIEELRKRVDEWPKYDNGALMLPVKKGEYFKGEPFELITDENHDPECVSLSA